MDRIFDGWTLLFLLGAGVVAFVIGLALGSAKSDTKPLNRAFLGAVLAILGGFLAHLLVSALLDAGNDGRGASLLIGWAFLLVPGAIDAVVTLFGGARPLTNPDTLLWIAAGVGAFTGMMNGIRRIHDWDGIGVPQFLGDVTWGLSGSTTAALLHVWNLFYRSYAEEPAKGAHRYARGFHVPGHATFAFTQGAVMSNLSEAPGGSLYKHERTHVFQSRLFGPMYVTTYLGWMAVMLVPAAIRGLAGGKGLKPVEDWCYFNNPWEVWGYFVQRRIDGSADGSDARASNSAGSTWKEAVVAGLAVPFFVLMGLLAVVVSGSAFS